MNIEDYRKIQEYKRLKVPIAKIVEEMNISEYNIKKYMKMTEEEFVNFSNDNKNIIDSYKDFIMDIIKVTPKIPDSNIYYKVLEMFPCSDIVKVDSSNVLTQSTFTISLQNTYIMPIQVLFIFKI